MREQEERWVAKELVESLELKVLGSLFLGRRLPGDRHEIQIPDPAFVLRHSDIYLLRDQPSAATELEHAGKRVTAISQRDLDQLLETESDVAFLQFRPAESDGDSVRVTLEARLATQHAVQALSATQIEFREVDGQWIVVDQPIALAY